MSLILLSNFEKDYYISIAGQCTSALMKDTSSMVKKMDTTEAVVRVIIVDLDHHHTDQYPDNIFQHIHGKSRD